MILKWCVSQLIQFMPCNRSTGPSLNVYIYNLLLASHQFHIELSQHLYQPIQFLKVFFVENWVNGQQLKMQGFQCMELFTLNLADTPKNKFLSSIHTGQMQKRKIKQVQWQPLFPINTRNIFFGSMSIINNCR